MSNVPVVSMFEAITGTPRYLRPELRNLEEDSFTFVEFCFF